MTPDVALVDRYVTSHPGVVARDLDRWPAAEAASLCASLPASAVAILLPHLSTVQAAAIARSLSPGAAADVLDHVPLDLAAALLRPLAADALARVLADVRPPRADALRALLAFDPGTAGAVMDTEVLTAPAAATVGETRALVDRHPAHVYYYLYALDAERRLAGVCDLAELMQADDGPLRAILVPDVVCLSASTPLAAVFEHPGWRRLDALPVVGPGRRFLGVLRHRRMRQLLERERPASGQPGVQTMMALGEIYWLGLCGLLQGIAATAAEPAGERGRP